MAVVGLVVHELRGEAELAARGLADWLADNGHELRTVTGEDLYVDSVNIVDPDTLADGLDVMVSLGGDGSILRAVELVADAGVPIMGANFGQLGYLTEFEPAGLIDAIARFLAGDSSIEERMRLAAEVRRGDGTTFKAGNALNEAIVEKVHSGRTVRLGVTIDGQFFTRYSADGLIVATPTGSTAYSLSARGPIVAPTYETLIVTAVAPHMLFDRSLVLDPSSEVEVAVVADRPASLAMDGRHCATLERDDVVVCRRSPTPARFVVGPDRSFLGVLKSKFGLNDEPDRWPGGRPDDRTGDEPDGRSSDPRGV